jgi:hypothetical protein
VAPSRVKWVPGPGGRRGAGPTMETGTTAIAVEVRRGHGMGSRGGGGGGLKKKIQCVEGTVQRSGREGVGTGVKSSQTLVKVWYICRLTNEYTGLSFSVHATFLGAGTEEYSLVIFLDTEEYNVNEECTLVSYSDDEMLD